MNYWMEEFIREQERECFAQYKKLNIPDVSNLVLLSKPNYKAKDGTIKRGIEIEGKYYAPKNDC